MSETEGFHINPSILHTFPPHAGGKMSETEGFHINPSILWGADSLHFLPLGRKTTKKMKSSFQLKIAKKMKNTPFC